MSSSPWLFVFTAFFSQLALLAPAKATVIWRGDFETGDLSQWSGTQIVSPDRAQVVTSPVRQGKYALRVEVQQGDNPINASGNRNELVKHDGSSEGNEYYYGWSTLWPADYPLTPTWQVFMQWHHPGCCGAPPVRFVLGCSAQDCGEPLPDTLFFIVDGQQVWTMAPVTRGTWHDFVLHVMWSADPTVGFVELWYDGELVVPKRNIQTLFNSSDANYLKMGLYRDAVTAPTAALFHDGLVQATTLEEVLPAPRAVDAGVPDGSTGGEVVVQPPGSTGASSPTGTSLPISKKLNDHGGGCSSLPGSDLPWVLPFGILACELARRRRARGKSLPHFRP